MDSVPCGRSCHTATLFNDNMIVFGGKEETRKNIVGKLLVYNFNDNKWISPKVEGKRPEPRMGHSACAFQNYIIFFGGWSGTKVLKDLVILDLSRGIDSMEFIVIDDLSKIEDESELKFSAEEECQPSPRQFHSANIIGNKMFVFGGGDGRVFIEELHVFDITTKKWYKPNTKGKRPEARLQHSSFVYKDNLYIFGGEPDQESNKEIKLKECYFLDTSTMTWSQINMNRISLSPSSVLALSNDKSENSTKELSSEISPYTRISATASVIKNSVFIFGGFDGLNWFNELYCFNLETNKLRIVKHDEYMSARCRHTAVVRETDSCYELCLYAGNNEFKNLEDIKTIKIPLDFENTDEISNKVQSDKKLNCTLSTCELKSAFLDAYLNNKYTDICFKVKDENFSAHSIFCAVKCNFFKDKIDKAFDIYKNKDSKVFSTITDEYNLDNGFQQTKIISSIIYLREKNITNTRSFH